MEESIILSSDSGSKSPEPSCYSGFPPARIHSLSESDEEVTPVKSRSPLLNTNLGPSSSGLSYAMSKIKSNLSSARSHSISDSDDGFNPVESSPPLQNAVSLSDSDDNLSPLSRTLTDTHSTVPGVREIDVYGTRSELLTQTSYAISEFQSPSCSQMLTNCGPGKGRKRGPTAENLFERKRLKELKLKEKSERAALADSVRRMRPGECMKYITILLDQGITEYQWGPAVIEAIQQANIRHQVRQASDPCTISWMIDQPDSPLSQEGKHVVFIWPVDKLLTSVKYCTLKDTFTDLKRKYKNHKLFLGIHGLHNYYRKLRTAAKKKNERPTEELSQTGRRKRNSNYDITEDRIEMELIALQVELEISHKVLNTVADISMFIQVMTKSVAELPYKLEREKMDMDRNWYAKGDSKNCVRVDKDYNGLSQLWTQQLSQFNTTSLDTAKAIARLYPTPLALVNAYEECETSKEKEQMLQEILVKLGANSTGRRLGPELSRKISKLYCQIEDILLN